MAHFGQQGARLYAVGNTSDIGETIVAVTGAKNAFIDKFSWNSTNIVVNNTTHMIMSGTVAVGLQVTVSGQVSTYNGTITFSDNNQAALILKSGKTYALRWQ